jgi:cell division control protein 7
MFKFRSTKWAPRAGTAGFRAPEVLFRSTHQTPGMLFLYISTLIFIKALIWFKAVDVWSAGIILLSILSGCYPFFKAVDDNMAIMQLISLFGYEPVRKAAYKYGRFLF